MSGNTVEPVRKQILVEAPPERAFRVFTTNVEAWWPPEHHIGKSPLKSVVLEGVAGGRWYEVTDDGSQCNWGKVLVWEPPHRLVLAWQLDANFQYDASLVTEVEVTFTPDGPSRTRVELEHRNLERFGEAAGNLRNAIDSEGGWSAIIARFAKVAAG